LLNTKGEVIGINSVIYSRTGSYSGIGLAIPSNTIAKEVPLLIKNGSYAHPWLGISGGKINPNWAKSVGLDPNFKGLSVTSVSQNSPAQNAGMREVAKDATGKSKVGDIITAIDGNPVIQISDIITYIETQKSVGDNITLTIDRDGNIMALTLTLQARPNTLSQTQQQQRLSPVPGLLPSIIP
jgi:S1-C subfamily serine protease